MAAASGSTSGANVIGLREFRAALEDLDGNWGSEMTLAHQHIASIGASHARAVARGMGGIQAKAASAIGERHMRDQAAIAVLPSALDRMANPAFWGAKRHTGWYAEARFTHSPAQFPRWVGNAWDVAGAGGPYAINPALRAHLPELLDQYLDMIDRIARRAFPER